VRWEWEFFSFLGSSFRRYLVTWMERVCVGYGRFGVVQSRAEQSAAN
jgi:hypothetical protein